jgi:ribosomal protein S18 acetylase RimI-like enzyme
MVPVIAQSAERLLSWEDGSRRAVALHHALLFRRPGVWADSARRPRSVVLLRRGETHWEAYGSGDPEPAVAWLARRRAPVALLAPDGWAEVVEARIAEPIRRSTLPVRFLSEAALRPSSPGVPTRRLTPGDAPALAAALPSWAMRAWDSPEECLARGAVIGVPYRDGFASLAWVTESDRHFDALGVWTDPRYRRLGLGRAAASALIEHVLGPRRKDPLWATTAENAASKALADSLGFTLELDEPLLRFGAGELAADPGP